MKRNRARFVSPNSINEMLKVLVDSRRDIGLFWTPIKKINSTSYSYGPGTRSHLFDKSDNLGLKLNLHQWEDSYFPVGYGKALELWIGTFVTYESPILVLSLKVEMLPEKVNRSYIDYISRFHQFYNISDSQMTYSATESKSSIQKPYKIKPIFWLIPEKVQNQKFNPSKDHFTGCLCFGEGQIWTRKAYYFIGMICAVFLIITKCNIIYFGSEITTCPITLELWKFPETDHNHEIPWTFKCSIKFYYDKSRLKLLLNFNKNCLIGINSRALEIEVLLQAICLQ